MKRKELLQNATCNVCGKPIGNSGMPLFAVVTIERHGIDLRAVQRADGLGAYLGSHALADVMGTDEDLTRPVMDPVKLTVCENCFTDQNLPVAELIERGRPA